MIYTWKICLFVLLIGAIALNEKSSEVTKLSSDLNEYKIRGYAQGTNYNITYFASDSIVKRNAIDSIISVIDSSMSLYKSYSLINKFNSTDTGVLLDRHFANVVTKSFQIFENTKGKFDITVKPLVEAWGFGAKKSSGIPDSSTVSYILKCVGMNKLILQNGVFLEKLDPCVQLDVNGVAQGYTVDVLADYMETKGLRSFLVELGGELRIKGRKPDGSFFKIGIEGPALFDLAQPEIRHVISLDGGAVTTSGNYRKYVESGGKKLTHLIDTKTGYPLENELISVTIYAKDAITADGYDNAIMAMGLKEGLSFLRSHKELEAYIIYRQQNGAIADTLTNGFKNMIIN